MVKLNIPWHQVLEQILTLSLPHCTKVFYGYQCRPGVNIKHKCAIKLVIKRTKYVWARAIYDIEYNVCVHMKLLYMVTIHKCNYIVEFLLECKHDEKGEYEHN